MFYSNKAYNEGTMLAIWPCGHILHKSCGDAWVNDLVKEKSPIKCPICDKQGICIYKQIPPVK